MLSFCLIAILFVLLLGWGLLVVGETNVSVNDGLCILVILKTNQLFIIWRKMIE